ncbi:hypothetical protein CDD81_6244 [Ophiocordyceps australis]|uniref:Peptide hydrolase n=1 Tax=Ophiocordyceps australis TaxID=1399860 RepID=A0A2C5Y6D8_9HYPO|nr:hypothetical protein CDD81_6244 [Ophiocordyceps australis]
MTRFNPFAFRPGQVTIWTTLVYLAVIVPLFYVHETVPPAPRADELQRGLNLTEAWVDLQTITRYHHPYNSHANDQVREYLMQRSKQILDRNAMAWAMEATGGLAWRREWSPASADEAAGAIIFDDRTSNVTFTLPAAAGWMGQYFEGSNFYVYIRGTDDAQGKWWLSENGLRSSRGAGGVLVNCHFDSVSTGYGATDDGMSCVSLLQLLSYFSAKGRQPKNGIVLLFNNAEEDGLLGARAFGYSPLLKFCHTFVNLEGAGAGGRAMLFRATDLQVAQAYSQSPHPFGSVVAANAFERGVIKSATDYEIFVEAFGQRGLDIAFYAPRSRYHTQEDDSRHTSTASIWHMLSAALESTKALSQTSSTTFQGPRADGRQDLVQNGRPTEGVWFDWYGSAWTAFPLRGLFAWSLTLLVATPLLLLLLSYLLARRAKYYFFVRTTKVNRVYGGNRVYLGGWKGFFRFPLAFIFAAGLTTISVYLVARFNPLIIYSSAYAVWAMTLSIFYFAFWLVMRGANYVRPSALHRSYVIMWLFVLGWALQVLAAVAEDRLHVGALYFAAFTHTALFLALAISLVEQFFLPRTDDLALQLHGSSFDPDYEGSAEHADRSEQASEVSEAATETTPLRAGQPNYGSDPSTPTFANAYRRSAAAAEPTFTSNTPSSQLYNSEQPWSARLPTWTWLLQLLLLVPVHVIILGNLGLVETTSTSMTGVDGSNLVAPLMAIGVIGTLLLLPLTPFIHRMTHHIPIFLLLVFTATLIYNLTAFPFSSNNRFKFYFQQTIDLDDGTNRVTLTGLEEYVRPVISSLPAAAGQKIDCEKSVSSGLADCHYDASGLTPNPAGGVALQDLVSAKVEQFANAKSATIEITARNTRMCWLDTSKPVFDFRVQGGGTRDDRFGSRPHEGFSQMRLWRRTWQGKWNVTIDFVDGDWPMATTEADAANGESQEMAKPELKARRFAEPLDVTLRCGWDDANQASNIPALDEVTRFMPEWAIVTKRTSGLVQVVKRYRAAG